METREQILEEQIKALKELIAIKDQIIQTLRNQSAPIYPFQPVPYAPPLPCCPYPDYLGGAGGGVSGSITINPDGTIFGCDGVNSYMSFRNDGSTI